VSDNGHGSVFVTGGGGVLGRALIGKLSRQDVVCLVHKHPVDATHVTSEAGDVCLPYLGLPEDTYRSLARRIRCIVHSAAVTDFTKPDDEILAVNVDGTNRVLEFAAAAGVPVYHVSTAYVQGHAGHEPTSYERSKIKSEDAVRDSGLPAMIVRPSVIVGDSVTGEIASFQGFHFLIGLFLRGLLPFVPAMPDSYIDFVPQDFVADVLAELIRQERVGGDVWVTAGTRALRIDDIVNCCIENIPVLPNGSALTRPYMISQECYERLFRPVFFSTLPKRQRRLMDRAMTMVKYLNTVEPLPSDSSELARSLNITQMGDPRATLRSSLLYWAQSEGRMPMTAGL